MPSKKPSEYWKSAIGLLGALATGVAGVGVVLQTDPNLAAVTDGAAVGWGAGVVAAGAAITGVVAALKRNVMNVEQIDTALEAGDVTIGDLKALLDKYRGTPA